MSLFIVSQIAKTRAISREQAKRAVYLQRQLAKPVVKVKPERRSQLVREAITMTSTVFCIHCSHDIEWKVALKQCNRTNGCNQWFCHEHIENNQCQDCRELQAISSGTKRGLVLFGRGHKA